MQHISDLKYCRKFSILWYISNSFLFHKYLNMFQIILAHFWGSKITPACCAGSIKCYSWFKLQNDRPTFEMAQLVTVFQFCFMAVAQQSLRTECEGSSAENSSIVCLYLDAILKVGLSAVTAPHDHNAKEDLALVCFYKFAFQSGFWWSLQRELTPGSMGVLLNDLFPITFECMGKYCYQHIPAGLKCIQSINITAIQMSLDLIQYDDNDGKVGMSSQISANNWQFWPLPLSLFFQESKAGGACLPPGLCGKHVMCPTITV